jgi:SAM-dependent methyltransferase
VSHAESVANARAKALNDDREHGVIMTEHDSRAMSSREQAASDIADWDRVADAYATAIGGPDDRIYAMLREGLWSSLGPDVSGLDILDLGCGHGWLSALLASQGARARGIDGSAALLAHARRIAPTVEFVRCDLVADVLPRDREYDRIVAHMVLMDLPAVDPVFSYVSRVLRPDGRFTFTLPHPCFFNYKTRVDPATGELYCGVNDYLTSAEWWIDSYGGHRHYHRSLTFYVSALHEHGLAVTRMLEPPQLSRKPENPDFYRAIPKFLMLEAQRHEP